MSATATFSPGELVHARGREWIVLAVGDALRLRPLTGSEQEAETLIPELETDPVTYAAFDPPTGDRPGGARPPSCSETLFDCPCAAGPVHSAERAGSTSSRVHTSLRRS